MTEQTVRVVLSAEPGSVSYARLFVRRLCETAALEGDACENAVLLTSETVTGALLGGWGRPALTVTTRPGWVRVEVGDALPGGTPEPALLPLTSRSAEIVQRLASSWGRGEVVGSPAVWFEVSAQEGHRAEGSSRPESILAGVAASNSRPADPAASLRDPPHPRRRRDPRLPALRPSEPSAPAAAARSVSRADRPPELRGG